MATETVMDRTSAPRRRFTLLDGMILVAATAVGCAGVQILGRLLGEDIPSLIREIWVKRAFAMMALIVDLISVPVLAAWTMALVPLGLLKSRPRPRRMGRQPGLMAGIAVSMAVGFMGLIVGVISATNPLAIRNFIELEVMILLPAVIGLAVAVAWMTLIVGRRWRSEPTWLDRMGRALGWLWIGLGLASPFLLSVNP